MNAGPGPGGFPTRDAITLGDFVRPVGRHPALWLGLVALCVGVGAVSLAVVPPRFVSRTAFAVEDPAAPASSGAPRSIRTVAPTRSADFYADLLLEPSALDTLWACLDAAARAAAPTPAALRPMISAHVAERTGIVTVRVASTSSGSAAAIARRVVPSLASADSAMRRGAGPRLLIVEPATSPVPEPRARRWLLSALVLGVLFGTAVVVWRDQPA